MSRNGAVAPPRPLCSGPAATPSLMQLRPAPKRRFRLYQPTPNTSSADVTQRRGRGGGSTCDQSQSVRRLPLVQAIPRCPRQLPAPVEGRTRVILVLPLLPHLLRCPIPTFPPGASTADDALSPGSGRSACCYWNGYGSSATTRLKGLRHSHGCRGPTGSRGLPCFRAADGLPSARLPGAAPKGSANAAVGQGKVVERQ